MAAETNRQSSTEITTAYNGIIEAITKHALDAYKKLIKAGVASESARLILPLTTKTKLYMNGTIRSWIHYLAIRADEHTQKEHRLIAEEIQKIFKEQFPTVYEAIYNSQ